MYKTKKNIPNKRTYDRKYIQREYTFERNIYVKKDIYRGIYIQINIFINRYIYKKDIYARRTQNIYTEENIYKEIQI